MSDLPFDADDMANQIAEAMALEFHRMLMNQIGRGR